MAVDEFSFVPTMQEGKLFTIELVPKSKQIEVKIAGNRLAKVNFTDLGLFARIYIGKREVVLTPVKQGQSFILTPPNAEFDSRLKLEVKSGSDKETFDFEVGHPK